MKHSQDDDFQLEIPLHDVHMKNPSNTFDYNNSSALGLVFNTVWMNHKAIRKLWKINGEAEVKQKLNASYFLCLSPVFAFFWPRHYIKELL